MLQPLSQCSRINVSYSYIKLAILEKLCEASVAVCEVSFAVFSSPILFLRNSSPTLVFPLERIW